MRLIDADMLLERIALLKNANLYEVGRVVGLIITQPTAYDIDKVVDELELHSFEFGIDALPAHYVRLNDAIEIVGGKK